MPWHCPACSTQIRHREDETTPRAGVIYRCAVCRLELTLDGETDKLTVAPLDAAERRSRLRGNSDRRKVARGGRRATDLKEPKWFRGPTSSRRTTPKKPSR